MPYAKRVNGEITMVCKWPNADCKEPIDKDSAEYAQFLQRVGGKQRREEAIQKQMRLLAIQQMKTDGKIDPTYPEPVVDDVSAVRNMG